MALQFLQWAERALIQQKEKQKNVLYCYQGGPDLEGRGRYRDVWWQGGIIRLYLCATLKSGVYILPRRACCGAPVTSDTWVGVCFAAGVI